MTSSPKEFSQIHFLVELNLKRRVFRKAKMCRIPISSLLTFCLHAFLKNQIEAGVIAGRVKTIGFRGNKLQHQAAQLIRMTRLRYGANSLPVVKLNP